MRILFCCLLYILIMGLVEITPATAHPFFDRDRVTWVNNHNQIAVADDKAIYLYTSTFELIEAVRIISESSPDRIIHIEWSADGHWLAVSISYRLQIWNWITRQLYTEFSDIDGMNFSWSPNAVYIAATDTINSSVSRFVVIERQETNGAIYRQIDSVAPDEIVWSADSQTVMYGAGGDTIFWSVAANTKTVVTAEELQSLPYDDYVSGRQYAIRLLSPGIWLIDFESHRLVRQLDAGGSMFAVRATSIKNNRIAGTDMRNMYVWNVQSGQLINTTDIRVGGLVNNLFWDEAGKNVLLYRFDPDTNSAVTSAEIRNATTGEILVCLGGCQNE